MPNALRRPLSRYASKPVFSAAMGILLFGVQGAGSAPPSRSAPGLDSLAAASLERALQYLELQPYELGFDKLYAEDDTFRLSVVEELLRDPLAVPAWQARVTADLRRASAAGLAHVAARLGDLAGAPADEALKRPPPDGAAPQVPLESRIALFTQRLREAEADLERAFTRLDRRDRERLLVMAPAFWGDWEEPAETTRKGRLHFELGFPADTILELDEDPVLDLAARLDRSALTRAAALFLSAVTDLAGDLLHADLPAARETLPGVDGAVSFVRDTSWGRLVIGGPETNVYSPEALREIAFLLEPGGDDLYRGRAASAVGGLLRPFAALVDAAGDDVYNAADLDFALGGAILGVAALIDMSGDDTYRGGDGVQGAGFFGAGFLYDGHGADVFQGRNLSQGAGAFGIGALVSDCTLPAPPGPEILADRAYEEGWIEAPRTGATPIRHDDNDTYVCARQSQGFGSTFGAGLLHDLRGNDVYRAGGRYLHRPLLPHDFQSLSQGFAIGFRPRAGGGVGILVDDEGNDVYNGDVYAQGTAYWYSVGLLHDAAGNDRYQATQYAQGAGVHLAVGSLWDLGGDDHYVSRHGVTHGTAHDLSVGWLLDESGDDAYAVSDGQAVSIANSAAIFIDALGDDLYATPRGGQGTVHWARGFCGSGIFLDLEGRDAYAANAPGRDGCAWIQQTYGLGLDLERDVDLPGETVPEIVLAPEDSLRDVEELFETASLWEVGSAREKVRRARKALLARGMTAVDYAVSRKLGTREGLEYRTLEELAKAFPDSFAARILPRLRDESPQVRRNVILLLGDLECTQAREPLETMLRERRYAKQWAITIRALGQIGEPESAPALRPFLRDDEERRRIYAAAALAALEDTTSLPGLVARLDDPVFTVRAAAKAALVKLGVPSIEPLCAALDVPAPQRALVLRALGEIAAGLRDSIDAPSLLARSRARRALMSELDRPLDETRPAARAAAVAGLMRLGDEESVAFVKLRLRDEFDPLVLRAYELGQEGGD